MDPFLYDEFYAVERAHWWAVGMRGIFHMLIESRPGGGDRRLLLDVGCGTGITMEEFGRHGTIYGLDVSWQALSYTRRRNPSLPVIQADVTRLPILPASLDLILALDVIEHLDDDAGGLGQMHDALKPGGRLLVNVPAFPSLWSGKDTANHHRRRYRRPDLRQVIKRAGFEVERITYTNAALFPAIWIVRQLQRRSRRSWNSAAEYHPASLVNRSLTALMRLERGALRIMDLPFGTSVTCLARKPGP